MAKRVGFIRRQILKSAMNGMDFPQPGYANFLMANTDIDLQKAVGDGRNSSVVVACMRWAQRNMWEAPLRVQEPNADGTFTPMPDHRMLTSLNRPNKYYDFIKLAQAATADRELTGNAYWLKLRSSALGGAVVEYWWVPSSLMEPKRRTGAAPGEFITHYEYTPAGFPIEYAVEDIVHFRTGLDPDNPMKGESQFKSLLREVYSDEEASSYASSILRNLGVPGVVISPKSDDPSTWPLPEDAKITKRKLEQAITGKNRGRALALSAPTDVQVIGFNPQQMNTRDMRKVPEERVTAVIGIPAVVIGFGAGLDRSTFANYAEAQNAAYENKIIPDQREIASEIQHQLLPDFEGTRADRLIVDFDLSNVRALQDDEDKAAVRMNTLVSGGIATVAEARERFGLPVDDTHRIFLRPLNLIETPAGAEGANVGQTTAPASPSSEGGDAAAGVQSSAQQPGKGAALTLVNGGMGKEGRVLSGRNASLVQSAIDALQALADAAAPKDVCEMCGGPAGECQCVPYTNGSGKVQAALGEAQAKGRLNGRQIRALVQTLERSQVQLSEAFGGRLERKFDDLGRLAADAYGTEEKSAPTDDEVRQQKAVMVGQGIAEAKTQDAIDAILVGRIMDRLKIRDWQEKVIGKEYRGHYQEVAYTTLGALGDTIGLTVGQPDVVAEAVLRTGGKRVGLLDLSTQTKQALFSSLESARAEGLGVEATGRLIRDTVGRGNWTTSKVRGQIVARTETQHAQRVSTLQSYAASGAWGTVIAIDARLGPTDDYCEERNGTEYSFDDAQAEADSDETHPNCTLMFVPGSGSGASIEL